MNSIVRRNVPEALSVEEVRKEYQKNASQTMVHPSKAESLQSMQKRKDLDIERLHRHTQKQTVRRKDL